LKWFSATVHGVSVCGCKPLPGYCRTNEKTAEFPEYAGNGPGPFANEQRWPETDDATHKKHARMWRVRISVAGPLGQLGQLGQPGQLRHLPNRRRAEKQVTQLTQLT